MKRVGYLYERVCSINNLKLADRIASRGKSKQRGVVNHRRQSESNILKLHESLKNKTYKTSEYHTFTLFDKKEREIHSLPYYPDRIVQHAIMNVLEKTFVATFVADTYSCIKRRGIHKALRKVTHALKDREGTKYCLKLDIKKFYPSVDNEILKKLLRRKFKDNDLLTLLDDIINSQKGIPIGNLTSQWFANYYLTPFDHWLKETKRVKYYFRYCDDIVILHHDKEYLHSLRLDIQEYLANNLNLQLKSNWQVFPIESRGLDFVGYKSYHDYILLRKSIKDNFKYMIRNNFNRASICSYYGWIKHCNGKNLLNTYIE